VPVVNGAKDTPLPTHPPTNTTTRPHFMHTRSPVYFVFLGTSPCGDSFLPRAQAEWVRSQAAEGAGGARTCDFFEAFDRFCPLPARAWLGLSTFRKPLLRGVGSQGKGVGSVTPFALASGSTTDRSLVAAMVQVLKSRECIRWTI
jgi:hypothetical protein